MGGTERRTPSSAQSPVSPISLPSGCSGGGAEQRASQPASRVDRRRPPRRGGYRRCGSSRLRAVSAAHRRRGSRDRGARARRPMPTASISGSRRGSPGQFRSRRWSACSPSTSHRADRLANDRVRAADGARTSCLHRRSSVGTASCRPSRRCSTRAVQSRVSVSRHRTRCRPIRTPVAASVPACRCRSTAPGGSSGAVRLSGRTITSSRPTSATRTTSSCGGSVVPIAAPGRRTRTTGPGGNPCSRRSRRPCRGSGRRRPRQPAAGAGREPDGSSRQPRGAWISATGSTHCWRTCRRAASGSEPAIPCAGEPSSGSPATPGTPRSRTSTFTCRTQPDLFSGARGLPVSFVDYLADGRRVARGTPLQGQFIQRG